MPEALAVTAPPTPFESASEMRHENESLLQAMDRRLGQDSRPESETAALRELEPHIRAFLDRGAATGVFVEDIRERTACQILLDYWSSTLSHAGLPVARLRLAPFVAARLPDLKDRACPFVGLEAFHDRTFFFGRDKAIDSLLARVAEVPLVVVQGASGSGKSSLVIGGALPVLGAPGHRPPYRIVGPFTPGDAPLESLLGATAAAAPGQVVDVAAEVAALRRDPGRLARMLDGAGATADLIVVDQFEEVFTLSSEADRMAFVAALEARLRAGPDHRVILTLREEFTSQLDELEPLRPYLARHARFSMKEWSMGYDELKAAVEGPAALVNLQFAPGIVDEMVKSLLGRDTALPLLQFALQSLWKLRDRNRITREVYAEIGSNPLAALEGFADGFYNGQPREIKDEVQRILLELVHIDRMLEPYRQSRLRSELLASGNPRTSEVLELLQDEDFVRITPTAGGRDAAVEVKHEALLRNWPRYIDWINSKRERVRQRIALSEAARRWHDGGRSPTEGLLGGWQIKEVEHLPDLSPLEAAYVRASAEAADRERIAREEALRRQERRKWIFAFAFVLLAAVVAGFWYMDRQRERRLVRRQTVDVQIRMARARDASTRGHLDDALIGSLTALAGVRSLEAAADTGALQAQAREMLLSNLRQVADLQRLFVGSDGAVFRTVAFHPTRPDAMLAFAAADGKTYLSGLDAPITLTPLDSCGGSVTTAVAFDRAGRVLAAGCMDGTLSVWSADDWRKLGGENTRVFDRRIWTIAVSPDARLIAAGGSRNQVALIRLAEDGAPLDQAPVAPGGEKPEGGVWSLAFAPAGDTLLVGDGAGKVLACKTVGPESWDCAKTAAYPGDVDDSILALAYTADGAQIAVGHWKGGLELWDKVFRATSRLPVDVGQSLGPVLSLAFFDACGRRQLAIGKSAGLLYRPVDALPRGPEPHAACALPRSATVGDEVYGIAVHDPSGRLATATRGGYVAVLDPKGGADPLRSVVAPIDTKQDGSLRGAILAEEGSTSWLALPIGPGAPDGANLALRRLRDGRIADGNEFLRLAAGDGDILRLSGSRQSRQLATLECRMPADAVCVANSPREVRVWRLADSLTGRRLERVVSFGASDFDGLVPRRLALSPDGKRLVVSFDASNRLFVAPLEGGGGRSLMIRAEALRRVREIAFSHDGNVFGAGGEALQRQPNADTDQVRLWDVRASALTEPDAGTDQVRLWDVGASGLTERKLTLALSPSANRVFELAFAADARRHTLLLLAGGESGSIDRWDVDSGEKLGTFRTDSAWPVYLIAFSPRDSLVAAADSQNVVRLWDTWSWIPLQLTPATDRFERPGFLAFVADGTWLAGGAGRLQLWDLDVGSLERRLCALLREPGQHGADSPTPLWRRDGLCAAP